MSRTLAYRSGRSCGLYLMYYSAIFFSHVMHSDKYPVKVSAPLIDLVADIIHVHNSSPYFCRGGIMCFVSAV